jgi:LmbE family N-acetylglucosaminyl deacetylase
LIEDRVSKIGLVIVNSKHKGDFMTNSSFLNRLMIKAVMIALVWNVQVLNVNAQTPKKYTSGEIYQQMEKLNFLGSVLYVAAHPDDENTRLISFLANSKKAHTTYLSLTRGDGGQNLIGTEMSELLGALRTQELLMARSIDNGHQMFTRANDFGYSKNAEETIRIWDTDQVKSDVVRAIRKTHPDVIINRFDHRTSGETHGHHTASAQLSYELFEKASDPSFYPDQLKTLATWQARRLFFNTSWWFYGSEEKFKNADKSALMSVDVGVFFPLLGKSNTEIAAASRSKHKCQGFGATGTRGMQMEYLELLKGDMPMGKSDIFEGINTTWTRVKNGNPVQVAVDKMIKNFDFVQPHKSIPALTTIYRLIQDTDDIFWKEIKTKEVTQLIYACAGLFLEAKTNVHKLTGGEFFSYDIEIINRSEAPIKVKSLKGIGFDLDTTLMSNLLANEPLKWSGKSTIPQNTPYTAPYWLTTKGSLGLYHVDDPSMIGMPESPRPLRVVYSLVVDGITLDVELPLVYKFNSPENGETYRPLEIVPPLTVGFKNDVYIFNNDQAKDVNVTVSTWAKDQVGSVRLPVPSGWTVKPESIDFTMSQKGESKDFVFSVTPSKNVSEIIITPKVSSEGQSYQQKLIDIQYDHIPYQSILMAAEAKFSKLDIKTSAKRIAYIAGAGDEIPINLGQIGCDVDVLKPLDITQEKLATYQSLVIGVRAYNTEEALKYKQATIFDFAKQGGTVVVQYNVSNGLVTKELAPFPLTLSRNRVTVEDAEMRILSPQHEVMHHPNQISTKDFEGWVQERGLYFPSEWDKNWEPILSCNDPGENPLDGSLLVAKYGEGYYVYTSLSFFRELPAGVTGAFRLFANLISLGHEAKP